MARFDPERLTVYRLAREHTREVHELIKSVTARGHADLVNQLRRSTYSIPANILEGWGEWRMGKRLNYLMIAKGSAWESWAHVDSMHDFGLIKHSAIGDVRDLQNQITALLITTIKQLEADGATEPPLDSYPRYPPRI